MFLYIFSGSLLDEDPQVRREAALALGLLARIVGDGLWLIDLFGLARPSAEDRAAVIDVVAQLLDPPVG